MASVRTVCKIKHHNVVSTGIFADEFPDEGPYQWAKQALVTLEEATEVHMLEVIVRGSPLAEYM
jgi:hypothetical protein